MKKNLSLVFYLFIATIFSCTDRETPITNLKMLEGGKTFAVPTGTVADQFVLKKFPDARIKYYNTVLDCALAVKDGKADAASYDLPVLKNIAAKNGGIEVLPELMFDDRYGFAVQLGNMNLKTAADTVLSRIKANGTYLDMMDRWFPDTGSPAVMPVFEFSGSKGVLKFGTAAVTEPMSFYDANRKVAGFDIEFASRIALYLDKKLEVIDMEFGAMLPALISGKVDMIGAGLSITEERAKSVLFSESYYPSGIAALVKSASKQEPIPEGSPFRSVKDIEDKNIGVLLGSVHDKYAKANFPKARIDQYQSVSDMIMALVSGKIDAALISDLTFNELTDKHDKIRILKDSIFAFPLGVGFNKENTGLRNQFNTFLAEIKANGVYDDMVNRWVNRRVLEMPVIENPGKNGSLAVGVSSSLGMPFAAVANGENVGFDVELGKRFAAFCGKAYVPVELIFQSILASLKTNKIDVATCGMMITEERQKEIDFSDPYLLSVASVIVKREDVVHSDKIRFGHSEDIKNKKIGVLMGSIHDRYAQRDFPDAQIMQYQNVTDMLMAVKTDKVDVAFADHVGLKDIFDKNPDLGIFAANLYTVPIAAPFNEEQDDLREKFNAFLREIKANGVYDDMVDRWINKWEITLPDIETTGTNGTLRTGIVSDLGLPFSFLHEGQPSGFDIELSRRFAAYLGKNYETVDMPFGSIIASLATNKIDLATCSMMITEEREKQVDFSDPYYESGISLFALKENIFVAEPTRMAVLDDISDKKVGVFTGNVLDLFVSEKYPEAEIYRFDNSNDMLVAVSTGKIDVAMLEEFNAKLMLKSNPDLGILTNDVLSLPLGVGFNKDNPGLRNEFNIFLGEIRKDGTYEKIYKRWFIEDAESARMPLFEKSASAKKLTVGIGVNFLPYVALVNGDYAGFDIEMIRTFAQRKNYTADFVVLPFPSLIPALVSGKVDMISDGMAITAERAEQINFSDSYIDFRTAVVAARKNLAAYADKNEKPAKKSFLKSVSESFHNNIVLEKRYLLILDGLKLTILISIFSAILGTIIGAGICFMRMSQRKLLSGTAKLYISLLRGTPVLVLLMIIYYVVFASVNISPALVAVVAFGLNFGAYVSEMFRTGIESVDKGQGEAGIAGGFTKVQTFIHIIMPQALRHVLPVYKGEFISLVKMTSIVGYIAVQDLTKASDIIRSRTFDAFFPLIMAAVIYLLLAWLLTWALGYVELSVDPKRKRLANLKEA